MSPYPRYTRIARCRVTAIRGRDSRKRPVRCGKRGATERLLFECVRGGFWRFGSFEMVQGVRRAWSTRVALCPIRARFLRARCQLAFLFESPH
jgi:hypothetical protein